MARQRKMTLECRAFINSLLEHYKPSDARWIGAMWQSEGMIVIPTVS